MTLLTDGCMTSACNNNGKKKKKSTPRLFRGFFAVLSLQSAGDSAGCFSAAKTLAMQATAATQLRPWSTGTGSCLRLVVQVAGRCRGLGLYMHVYVHVRVRARVYAGMSHRSSSDSIVVHSSLLGGLSNPWLLAQDAIATASSSASFES